jgi:hypothetical protein
MIRASRKTGKGGAKEDQLRTSTDTIALYTSLQRCSAAGMLHLLVCSNVLIAHLYSAVSQIQRPEPENRQCDSKHRLVLQRCVLLTLAPLAASPAGILAAEKKPCNATTIGELCAHFCSQLARRACASPGVSPPLPADLAFRPLVLGPCLLQKKRWMGRENYRRCDRKKQTKADHQNCLSNFTCHSAGLHTALKYFSNHFSECQLDRCAAGGVVRG